MKKSFKETKAKLSEGKGTGFSKGKFSELTAAMLSDKEGYTGYERVKVKGGELVKEQVNPAEEFRGLIGKKLVEAGLDKEDAKKYVDEKLAFSKKEMEFTQDFVNETVYNYMETGKSYQLGTREEFQGKISLKEEKAGVRSYRNPAAKEGEDKEIKIEVLKDHNKLVAKGGVPEWLKKRV